MTMTRVLVVNHDLDVADIEADELRKAGYEVDQCQGPTWAGACPVMRGEKCWQVERADVLLYDVWELPDGRGDLIDDLRRWHPDKPIAPLASQRLARQGGSRTSGLIASVEAALRTHPAPIRSRAASPFRGW
jgi:DNA-binding response OmpR family regulator